MHVMTQRSLRRAGQSASPSRWRQPASCFLAIMLSTAAGRVEANGALAGHGEPRGLNRTRESDAHSVAVGARRYQGFVEPFGRLVFAALRERGIERGPRNWGQGWSAAGFGLGDPLHHSQATFSSPDTHWAAGGAFSNSRFQQTRSLAEGVEVRAEVLRLHVPDPSGGGLKIDVITAPRAGGVALAAVTRHARGRENAVHLQARLSGEGTLRLFQGRKQPAEEAPYGHSERDHSRGRSIVWTPVDREELVRLAENLSPFVPGHSGVAASLAGQDSERQPLVSGTQRQAALSALEQLVNSASQHGGGRQTAFDQDGSDLFAVLGLLHSGPRQ